MAEWNAEVYHRVSDPQLQWGPPVLARLPLAGRERVLDIGCGTGRPTERLLDRLPRGRVVAVDRSANMLDAARAHLSPRHAHHAAFVRAAAAAHRLRRAGFGDVRTWLEASFVVQPDAAARDASSIA